jgi:glycine/D-amino acid oxidase-like deaminating enzyme
MTVSIWQANGEQATQNTDVAIIGAGLLGCTAAYYLKQAGCEPLLIDARDVGLGASSRNAGFMLTGLDQYYHQAEARYGEDAAREIWTLSQRSHAFWREIGAQFDVTMDHTSSLLLAESAEEAEDLQQAARRMDAQGFDCEYLANDPLERGYFGAIRQPGDGGLHPYQLVQAIFAASDTQLIANSEVYAIEPDGAEVIVYSQKAIVRARQVLICTNAYSVHLDNFFRDKIVPVRAQCLATAPLPEPVVNAVGYSDYGYMYYRDLPDGGLLVGGARKNFKVQENDTTDDRATDPVQRALTHYLRTRFPEVDAPVVRRWAGIMAFTSDGLPLVGSLPRDERIIFAVGLNGHGLSLGAAVADRAVDKLLNGADAGVFDAARLMG